MAATITSTPAAYPLVEFTDASLKEFLARMASVCRPEDIEDVYPCTPMQESVLISQRYSNHEYFISVVVEIESLVDEAIDLSRLQHAWTSMVKTSAILRTCFVEHSASNGVFSQVVLKQVDSTINIVSSSSLEELNALPCAWGITDVAPHSMRYCEIPGQGRFLRLDVNHAIADGMSLYSLMTQLQGFYDNPHSRVTGIEYRDFVQHVGQLRLQDDLSFWANRLSSTKPTIFPQLGARGGNPTQLQHGVGRKRIKLDRNKIRTAMLRGNISLTMFFQAAWAVLLQTYLGSDEVLFGYVSSGRRNVPLEGIDKSQGAFVSQMVATVEVVGTETWIQLAERLGRSSKEDLQHEHCSLADIQKSLNVDTLFNTVMDVQRLPPFPKTGNKLRLHFVDSFTPTSHLLVANVEDRGTELLAKFSYLKSGLSELDVDLIMNTFAQIVDQFVDAPERKIQDFDLVGASHRRIMENWNEQMPASVNICVHHLIERRAAAKPDAPAICSTEADGQFTYGRLNGMSDRLAAHLSQLGVCAETMVPFCFEKSPCAIVVMLAILKAGGACVALDPGHPIERLKGIIRQTDARLIVCQEKYKSKFDDLVPVVGVHPGLWDSLEPGSVHCPASPTSPSFVTFTSGSTGVPKGIVLTHASLSTSIGNHGKVELVNASTRALQFGSYTFDVSVEEIFTTLSSGGCVCVPSEYERLNSLEHTMEQLGVNWAHLTPTVAGLLRPSLTPSLETLVLGGEAIPFDTLARWQPYVRLIASYGPAECSITCSAMEVTSPAAGLMGMPAGALLWIVDPTNHNRLMPIGCPGEILIEGPLLARGYLNEEQTKVAFVSNLDWSKRLRCPRAAAAPRRFYKSGDMARFNVDGSIVSVGRKDSQVKVNGQRVDLGEIEHHVAASQLTEHVAALVPNKGPSKDSVTLIFTIPDRHSDGRGDSTLSPRTGTDVTKRTSDLRVLLEERVPQYMMPRTWICMSKVPVTVNGKLDRRRILSWLECLDNKSFNVLSRDETDSLPAQQLNPMETLLRHAWSSVLGLPELSISTSQTLFSLGGDSITAIQICSILRDQGVQISVQDVLRFRTITEIAKHAASNRVAVQPITREEHIGALFPLSPIQKMHFDRNAGGLTHYNQSIFLKLIEPVTPRQIRQALESVVERHSMLRARFQVDDSGAMRQKVSLDTKSSLRFETIDSLSCLRDAAARVNQAHRSLDIHNGPLVSAQLLHPTGETQYLSVAIHHLVIDVVSWHTLLDDLQRTIQSGHISNEVAPPFSFQVWNEMQIGYAATQQEASLHPDTALPFDLNDINFVYWGVSNTRPYSTTVDLSFTLDEQATAVLMGSAGERLGCEPVDLLLSAIFFSFWEAFPDRQLPTVFSEGHGREPWDSDIDVSRTLGWFTTIYPISVTQPSTGELTFAKALQGIKDARGMLPSKGWAYFASRYLTEAGGKAFGSHQDMEILFNYLGEFKPLDHSGALFERVEPPFEVTDVDPSAPRAAMFDVLALVERGKLTVKFSYSSELARQGQIRTWVQSCKTVLHSLPSLTQELGETGVLPCFTDYPLLHRQMDYSDLGVLVQGVQDQLSELVKSSLDIEDIYPCTPMQQGIMVGRAKQDGLYDSQEVWKLVCHREPGHVQRLEAAIEAVVNRHQMLRTYILQGVGSVPYVQAVLRQVKPSIARLHLDSLDSLISFPSANFGTLPFTYQFIICEIESCAETFCRLEINHALVDGISVRNIAREISEAYDGRLPQSSGPLYKSFVQYLQNKPTESSLTYWSELLKDSDPCHLPALNEVQIGETAFRSLTCDIGDRRTAAVHKFCREAGTTTATLMSAAWAIVLRAYTGTDDVCFGYLSSGRDAPVADAASLIGPLINMLVRRVQFEVDSSVPQIVRKIHDDMTGALEHQHCSLAEIYRSLGQGKQRGRDMFNTVVNVQKGALKTQGEGSSLGFEVAHVYDPSEYDVTFNVNDDPENILFSIQYWTSCLLEAHAELMRDTLLHTVDALTDNPSALLKDLDLCSASHKVKLLDINATLPPAINLCVHQMVERHVEIRPHALAISTSAMTLTYAELDTLAALLAGHLASFGVGPGSIVPFCFDKSAWGVIVMYAVLKAGGACVGLSPDYPRLRTEAIVQSTGSTLLICSTTHAHKLGGITENTVVLEDKEDPFETMLGRLKHLPRTVTRKADPSTPAFVTFTSGSTGTPKGIVIEHGSMCTNMHYNGIMERMAADARSLQFGAYTFDVSLDEIFTTLSFGGCVCVPSQEEKMGDLALFMSTQQVTWSHLTPTVAGLLEPDTVPTLKTLVLGGELISQSVAAKWAKRVELIASYGPAECSVTCSGAEVDAINPRGGLMGHATAARLWLVDPKDHNKLAPVGCVGEIMIEGPLLARGYLDADQTALAFITNPTWSLSVIPTGVSGDRRFYKTGDMARYELNGSLHSAGRKDSQVKVHGQRTDLGEIEHHISAQNPRHAAAFLPVDGYWKGMLVCVFSPWELPTRKPRTLQVIMSDDVVPSIIKFRSALQERVPPHMVPRAWIAVESVPLTQNGKLDRRRLVNWLRDMDPVVCQSLLALGQNHQPSSRVLSNMEAVLVKAWSAVLDMPEALIGVDQPFFTLGGDSISAMQVASKLRSRGIDLTVHSIMRNKTVSAIAPLAVYTSKKGVGPTVKLMERDEETSNFFPLSPIQRMFFKTHPIYYNHYNQSKLMRFRQSITVPDKVEVAIQMLVERHSMLRARFCQGDNKDWLQRIEAPSRDSWRFIQSEVRTMRDAQELFSASQKTLNIQEGPIFSVDAVTISGQVYLYFVAHHLAVDIVSWKTLLGDLEGLMTDKVLPGRPLSFHTWALAQSQHYSKGDILETNLLEFEPLQTTNVLEYWGMQGTANTYESATAVDFALDRATTTSLLGSSNYPLDTEPLDIIIAGIIASHRSVFLNRSPPVLFSESHGRQPWDDAIDLSKTVGWFTSILPIYNVSKAADAVQILREVKDVRHRLSQRDFNHFSSCYLSRGTATPDVTYNNMEILFNFLGTHQAASPHDSLFEQMSPPDVLDVSLDTNRSALFDISAAVEDGQLRFRFIYSTKMSHQRLINSWVANCQSEIEQLAKTLLTMSPMPTMADYPMLKPKEYKDLDNVVNACAEKVHAFDRTVIENICACSPMQEGILLSQSRQSELYNVQVLLKIGSQPDGRRVDIAKLKQACKDVIARHQMLRTYFVEVDQSFLQVVLKSLPSCPIYTIKVPDIDSLECELASLTRAPRSPPYSFTVCETGDGELWFKLDINHAMTDGTSTRIIASDIMKAYGGTLAPDGPAYSDFISHIQSIDETESINYWKTYLEGVDSSIFPSLTEGSVSSKGNINSHVHVELTPEHSKSMHTFCKENDITMATLISSCWAIVLRAFLGPDAGDQVCFGYLAAGRDVPVNGVYDLVGPLVTMMIRRADVRGDSTVKELIERLQDDFVEGLPYQHTSLGRLQHELDLSGRRLFNTIVNLQKGISGDNSRPTDQQRCSLGGLQFEEFRSEDPNEYDVCLNIMDAEVVSLSVQYWQQHLSPEQATSLAETLATVIKSVVADHSQKLSDVDLTGIQGRMQIEKFNHTLMGPVDDCIHFAIERMAQKRPDAPAICATGPALELTYREVNAMANSLASRLIELGVTPDTIVPFCFDKSPWAIIVMLAILKAGGACVALDPAHPGARLRATIEDVGASVVVTAPDYTESFKTLVPHVVSVDSSSLREGIGRGTGFQAERTHQSRPENAAIVIFTSGSTGKPKGVVLEHRAFCATQASAGPAMHVKKTSRVLQFSAFTFDLSTEDIFSTLMVGGCVCVPAPQDRLTRLAEAIVQMRCNYMALTPTVAGILHPDQVPLVKTLALGGELPHRNVYERWAGKVKLINGYGPSECTIWTVCNIGVEEQTSTSNIGSTKVNCSVYIVDPSNHNRLMPVGVPGEFLIGGHTLARGYLNNREKTEASFISSPTWFCGPRDERFYKSGDIGRYNPDGTITFVGRKDTQVKIYGQRVELEEIRHHLANMERIRHVIVAYPKSGLLAKRLTAVLCLGDIPGTDDTREIVLIQKAHRQKASRQLAQIRSELEECLPKHMIPSTWVVVDNVPLVASGKLDKVRVGNWLESVNEDIYQTVMSFTPQDTSVDHQPANETERLLRNLWADVLKREAHAVSTNQTFLHLGGDSILAMHLVSKARAIGLNLFVQDVMRLGTIEKLGVRAMEAGPIQDANTQRSRPFSQLGMNETSLPGFLDKAAARLGLGDRSNIEDAFPCAPMQEGIIISQAKNPDQYWIRATYKLNSPGQNRIDVSRLLGAFTAVIDHHQSLRSFLMESSLPEANYVQVVARKVSPPITTVECDCLESLENIRKSQDYTDEKELPYRIAIGHIPRTGETYCTLDITHALDDGASRQTLLRDLSAAYRGSNFSLARVPGFVDYVRYIRSQPMKAASAFWNQRMADVAPCHFPVLHNAKPPSAEEVPCVEQILDPRRAATIQRLCSDNDITVADVFKTVWGVVLSAYVGSESVCFGYLTSGRDAPLSNVNDIIGPLISMVPCRFQIDEWSTLIELAKKTHEDHVQSMGYQHFPLKELARLVLGPGSEPLFNTAVNVMNADPGAESLQPGGLSFNSIPVYSPTEYALSLDVIESGGKLRFVLDYQSTFVSRAQAENIAASVDKALDCFIRDPEKPASKTSLFSDRDAQFTAQWITSGLNLLGESQCLHRAFEEQITLQPDAEAVVSDQGSLTYAELDVLANGLAHVLIQNGAGPGVVVPFCFEKSTLGVIAILSILKSGAACVGLDASHPSDRMASVINDTQSTMALSSPANAERLMQLGLNVIPVTVSTLSGIGTRHRPVTNVTPEDLAWVVTTSGSTGTPKCAALEHRNLFAMSQSLPHLNMSRRSRVGHFAAYAYDVSVEETILALTQGACVCVLSETDRLNNLADAVARLKIDWMELTPTVLRMLDPDQVPSLKTVILGGELLPNDLIEKWSDRVDLFNSYGPCECSITATVTEPLKPGCQGTNVGKPWASNFWVVDPRNPENLQPVGAVGELIIQGPLVGRGYLNNPSKSKAAFIKPLQWAPSELGRDWNRFYRTGDLVRWNDDGSLIYIGRKDTQVKIRGQRVELGEIEHHVRANQLLKDVVALVPSQGRLKQRLVAVVTLRSMERAPKKTTPQHTGLSLLNDPASSSRAADEVNAVRLGVEKVLPRHMVPGLWVIVESFPMLPSGKTNRSLIEHWLGAVDQDTYFRLVESSQQSTEVVQQPSSEMEVLIQRLWGSVLDIPTSRIGVTQSFFSLGGDSVLAMQLIVKARSHGITMTARQIFQQRTIAAIAPLCTMDEGAEGEHPQGDSSLALPAIPELVLSKEQLDLTEDVYPCSPMQESILNCQSQIPNSWYASFFFELQATGSSSMDVHKAGSAWQQLVDRHRILRTTFAQSTDSGSQKYYQVVAKDYEAPISYVTANSAVVSQVFDLNPAMPCSNLPPHRLVLAEEKTSGRVFAQFQMSHALYDAVSVSLLWHDIQKAYSGVAFNNDAPLYRDFIAYTQSRGRQDSIQFWQQHLKGLQPSKLSPRLQPDCMKEEERSFKSYVPPFDPMLGSKVRSIGNKYAVTTGNIFQAAWAIVLQQLLKNVENEVTFGYMLSGRDAPIQNADTTLGPFINLLPCRVKLDRDTKVPEFLQQVQDDLVDVLMHQTCSVHDIEAAVRLGSDTPMFSTFFNMQKVVACSAFADGDLEMKEIGGTMSDEYTISVYVVEQGERIELSMNYWSHLVRTEEIVQAGRRITEVIDVLFEAGQNATIGGLLSSLTGR